MMLYEAELKENLIFFSDVLLLKAKICFMW